MSKRQQQTSQLSHSKQTGLRAGDGAQDSPVIAFKPAMKPHPRLFVGLLVVLLVWIGVLVGLYVKTVYVPRRVKGSTTAGVR